jgi:hypothetical protein
VYGGPGVAALAGAAITASEAASAIASAAAEALAGESVTAAARANQAPRLGAGLDVTARRVGGRCLIAPNVSTRPMIRRIRG